MKKKTRATAARLDRFKPWADTWKQRRCEDIGSYKLYCPTCCKKNEQRAAGLATDLPEPFNCTPYYIAALVFCALLILDGFLAEWGFINYAPILK